MTEICACGSTRKGDSDVIGASASWTHGSPGTAPPGPRAEGDAKSVVTSVPCPRRVLKTW